MKTRSRWSWTPGLLAAVLGAGVLAGEPAPMPRVTSERLAFGPGEQATYRVEYLGVTAGTAQVTVGSEVTLGERGVLPIVSIARSDARLSFYPIRDRFVTYWDPVAGRCVGSDLFADENGKRRRQRIRLDHGTGSAVVVKQKDGQQAQESTHQIQPGTADVAAATFLMRSQELRVGAEFKVPIFTGTRSFVMNARVEGKMMLKTPLGEREVYRIRTQTDFSGKLQATKDMFAYLTTDRAHLPVRIEAEFLVGTVVAELTDYQEGSVLAAR